jgi:hypothetical protein
VWPHYFVLLFVVVALYKPSLDWAWIVFVPLWVLPWESNRVGTVLTAFAIVGLALTLTQRRAVTRRSWSSAARPVARPAEQ